MGIQAFQFINNIFGVQFHPEFNIEIMSNYIKYRKNNGISIKLLEGKNENIYKSS